MEDKREHLHKPKENIGLLHSNLNHTQNLQKTEPKKEAA
jgi:hypothetical protein